MKHNKDLILKAKNEAKLLKLNTEMWFSIKNNNIKNVSELIEAGANLHLKNGIYLRRYNLDENTALHKAAEAGYSNIVLLLIKNGAKINTRNRQNQTPLQWASYKGHNETVEILLNQGADVNAIDDDGDTAFTWAANNNQKATVNILIAAGADPNRKSDLSGNSALHWVAISGVPSMAKYLIELGSNPKEENIYGETPIDLAIENANQPMIDFLLNHE